MSKFKDWFTEDDDDIFFGSPKSKFFDIMEQTHRDLLEDELDKVFEKLAILELIVGQGKDEDFDINSFLQDFKNENQDDVNSMKKGLYMEVSGEIISRLDS
jgi:ferritin